MIANARIAIVHEWWAKFGGSESVVKSIAEILPNADVFCLYIDSDASMYPIQNRIYESWLKKLPFHENRRISAALSIASFRTLSLKTYDLILSSSHTFAHTAKFLRSRDATYLSYIHTPSRALWLKEIDSRADVIGLDLIRPVLKTLDKRLGRHVKSLAVNSHSVKKRVKDFWDQESVVIHPPVDLNFLSFSLTDDLELFPFAKGEYLVTAGRFVSYKKHNFSMQVAESLKMPIVVMGSGPEEYYLRKFAESIKTNVHFEIAPDRARWLRILKNANSMIFPPHEDFGITPIEAMGLGTPVLALAAGGALDFVRQGVNGVLSYSLDVRSFCEQFDSISKLKTHDVIDSVAIFKKEVFQNHMVNWIQSNF